MNSSRNSSTWMLRWLFRHPRVHVTSSHVTYALTIALGVAVVGLVLTIFQLTTRIPSQSPRADYLPMVQLNRGNVNKREVLQNARISLEKVAAFKHEARINVNTNVSINISDSKEVIDYLMLTVDKKEKRQFMALEGFQVYDMNAFEKLITQGYTMKDSDGEAPAPDYKSWNTAVEFVVPDYGRLCYKTAFTVSNLRRPVDDEFCTKLRNLETAIKEGRELPLLTIFTWWKDPITDMEVLSKRAVMTNWDLLRPFIIPVVVTNFRMNMAVANAHGWPCLPVRNENDDGIPIFRNIAAELDKEFRSLFYGYAVANSLFDVSLLQTLLAAKEQLLTKLYGSKITDNFLDPIPGTIDGDSFLITGNTISLPALGSEAIEKFDYLHKHIESAMRRNNSSNRQTGRSYVIYRNIDFSEYDPVIIDDTFLIPYLLQRSVRDNVNKVDTSKTILSIKTYRTLETNEWGRNFIKVPSRDDRYNRRFFDKIMARVSGNGGIKYMTTYGDKNRIKVMKFVPFD